MLYLLNMPIFDRERAESNTEYRSTIGTPVTRKEEPTTLADLTPELRDAIGFTVIEPKLVQVEVRGGSWTHNSARIAEHLGYEGEYNTRFAEDPGTLYGVYTDGGVHIVSNRPISKFGLLDNSALLSPRGIGAEVRLEEGGPVLRYVEVKLQPFIISPVLGIRKPEILINTNLYASF